MVADTRPDVRRTTVRVPLGLHGLTGTLSIPDRPVGVVLFAHGSGSSRMSPRNQYVAELLHARHLATLLIDLLTPEEELVDDRTAEYRFDIAMLGGRLTAVIDWLRDRPDTALLPIGLFGASTGAAAALLAAASRPGDVMAIVSRGGRPDLAVGALKKVVAPTLLIVGERDVPVIHMNREAMKSMTTEAVLEIVPGATHLFPEPGALDHVATRAAEWFVLHVRPVFSTARV